MIAALNRGGLWSLQKILEIVELISGDLFMSTKG